MNIYRISTIPLVMGLILIFSSISPSTIYTEERIQSKDSIFIKVGDIGVKKASEKGLTTLVNEKIRIEDQTILLTESLYDGSSIHLAYLITSYNEKDTLRNRFIDGIKFTRNESPYLLRA